MWIGDTYDWYQVEVDGEQKIITREQAQLLHDLPARMEGEATVVLFAVRNGERIRREIGRYTEECVVSIR